MTELANLESQAGLIEAAFMSPAVKALVLSRLTQNDFFGVDRELFPIMEKNHAFVPDDLSPAANERLLELDSKLRIVPNSDHVAAWMADVENTRNLVAMRTLMQQGAALIKPGVKAEDIGGLIVSRIASMSARVNSRTNYGMADVTDQGVALYERWLKGESAAGLVPTGIEALDRKIGGMMLEHVTVIGGPSGSAKTSVALQIMRNVALREKSLGRDSACVFVSLDMSPVMVGFRLASSMSGVNWQDVRRNTPGTDKAKWVKALKALKDLPLEVLKMPQPTAAQIMQQLELIAAVRKDGISMVCIDFIEMMRGEGSNETAQVSNIMIGTKTIAERFKCPVVDISQVSREVMKSPARIPEKQHLKQSSTIENVAQTILMPYYPGGYAVRSEDGEVRFPNKTLAEAHQRLAARGANYVLTVPKDRDGEAGVHIDLWFEPEYTRFDAPHKSKSAAPQRQPVQAEIDLRT